MSRIIGFVGTSGGIGKTSIVYDLSIRLSMMGYRVCSFDACFNNNSLSSKFNIKHPKDLKDWLIGDFDENCVLNKVSTKLSFVKTNIFQFDYLRHVKLIKSFIEKISEIFDYVLVDFIVGDERFNEIVLTLNEICVISGDDKESVLKLHRLRKKFLFYNHINVFNIVINKANLVGQIYGKNFTQEDIENLIKVEVLFVIPKFFKRNYFSYKNTTINQVKIMTKFCNAFITNKRVQNNMQKKYLGVFGFIRRKLHEQYE